MLLHESVDFFKLLWSISLYKYIIICLPVIVLIDIWVILQFLAVRNKAAMTIAVNLFTCFSWVHTLKRNCQVIG